MVEGPIDPAFIAGTNVLPGGLKPSGDSLLLALSERVDSLEFLVTESQVVQGSDVLFYLLYAGGSDQRAGDGGETQCPGKSHLRQGLPTLLCHLVQCDQRLP